MFNREIQILTTMTKFFPNQYTDHDKSGKMSTLCRWDSSRPNREILNMQHTDDGGTFFGNSTFVEEVLQIPAMTLP